MGCSVITWNVMIGGFVEHGCRSEGADHFSNWFGVTMSLMYK